MPTPPSTISPRIRGALRSQGVCRSEALTLAPGRTSVSVSSTDPVLLGWLSEYLRPWFPEASAQPTGWQVEISTAADEYAALHDLWPADAPRRGCFAFDQFVFSLPAWDEGDRTILADRARSCFLVVAPDKTVRLIADPSVRRWRVMVLWLVLEIAALTLRRTHADLHAASVELSGRAVLFSGPKESGKTTLLLHWLRSGLCRWMANDRVLVGGEPWGVTGMPAAVRIRGATVGEFPELFHGIPSIPRPYLYTLDELDQAAPGQAEEKTDVVALSPAQLSRQMKVEPVGTVPLGAMVFPRIVRGLDGWTMDTLAPGEIHTRLRWNLYGRTLGPRELTVFEKIAGAADVLPDGDLRALAESLPGYRLNLGPNAYEGADFATRFLDSLVTW